MKLAEFSRQTMVFTTSYVIDGSDIVYVSLDADGDLTATSSEGVVMEKAMIVSLQNVVDVDATILDIPEIAPGDAFQRAEKGSTWNLVPK